MEAVVLLALSEFKRISLYKKTLEVVKLLVLYMPNEKSDSDA
ncbi:MAG: hypothetical protein QXN75_06440 [Thermoproteota archaeon]